MATQIQDTKTINAAELVQKHRNFFNSGKTQNVDFRVEQLKKLKQLVVDNENRIKEALYKDLHKSDFEAYGTEIGFVLKDIDHTIKTVRKWARPEKVRTPLFHQLGSSWIQSEPLGVVYVIAPWNYPFQLLLAPAIGAIAAGNTVIMKPSRMSEHTCRLLEELINNNFPENFLKVVSNFQTCQELLEERFDYIFFTGGKKAGTEIYEKAAKNLTPVTLELGGKSPCFVDESIDMKWAIKRLVWGKFTNAGQTCVAPDYFLVDNKIKKKFIEEVTKTIKEFYGENPKQSENFGRIITERHFIRVSGLLKNADVVCGGDTDISEKYIAPTILDNVKPQDAVMQEEIFGPLMPIIGYDKLEDAIALVKSGGKPLALYIFSGNKACQQKILQETSSGNASVNECLMHVGQFNLPFGGVGDSGIGQYHGKLSFDIFSHRKGVLKKSTLSDLPLRFPPYDAKKVSMLKKLMDWLM
jgi:acyl-CoA reductase-like NAD-dependent aldehyde dehydrogenase